MIRRVLLALAGSTFGALVVAWLEANVARSDAGGAHVAPMWRLTAIDLGLIAPIALLVGVIVGMVSRALEPENASPPWVYGQMSKEATAPDWARAGAIAALRNAVLVAWMFIVAPIATRALSEGTPAQAGIRLAALAGVVLVLLLAAALSLLGPLTRVYVRVAVRSRWAVHPRVTGGFVLLIGGALLAWGISQGDPSGDGSGLLVFGVLRRRELDLRPVADLLAIAFFAYVATWFLPRARLAGPLAAVLAACTLAFTAYDARALDGQMDTSMTLERYAPLGKRSLALLRKASDRDHDGAARFFGGGDCNDRDPDISPSALDIPGNGVDEDCSGEDEPAPTTLTTGKATDKAIATKADGGTAGTSSDDADVPATYDGKELNLLLITVDTLRPDVGFMGYPKPTTPNLDKLAEKSVVFDDAYSLASYTGKALGPLLIGKYPSETLRDGGHFNTYFAGNVFLAERAKAAGLETLGAATHWYFSPWSGLLQGIDVWDLSARPGGGQGDTDGNVTGDRLSDVALKLLARPELAEPNHRFFMWLHYFDPHAQYMPHPGMPDFAVDATGPTSRARAAYDGEVWFTDQQIGRVLDALATKSFGAHTAVIVTADHGEAFNDHGMSMHGGELWESLVKVPLLVNAPGLPPHHVPVKRSDIDLVPTAIDLLSLAPPGPRELSGVSLLPDLLSKSGPYAERDVYIDMPAGPYTALHRALIHGPTPGTKLISFGTSAYELFDLAKDPEEKEDLTSDKDLFTDMLQRMKTLRGGLKEIDVKPDDPK